MLDFGALKKAMGELDEQTVSGIIAEVMRDGGKEAEKAMTACQEGLGIVGDLFEKGEYFVGDLIYGGEIMSDAVTTMKTALVATGDSGGNEKMILCTVQSDLHDIGKNIVKAFMEASGFEVFDLGIDTAPETIVEAAKEKGVGIIALSGVLTLAVGSMKKTVEAFEAAGIRGRVKIIIGGNPTSEDACRDTGADAWAHSPQETVRICRQWAAAL